MRVAVPRRTARTRTCRFPAFITRSPSCRCPGSGPITTLRRPGTVPILAARSHRGSAPQDGAELVTDAVLPDAFPLSATADAEWSADRAVVELYSEHYRSLVRLAALLVRDTPTAEEVVQDAFVAMHDGWQRLRDTEKALAYLRQAVVNRSRSVLRHRTVVDKNLQKAPPDMPSAEHGAMVLLERSAVVAALRDLPDRQREAIVLRYYADLSEARDRRRDGHQPRRGQKSYVPRHGRPARGAGARMTPRAGPGPGAARRGDATRETLELRRVRASCPARRRGPSRAADGRPGPDPLEDPGCWPASWAKALAISSTGWGPE